MAKKPSPVFEVIFAGAGIYPEQIPIGTLARTLSAIQRLAAGEEAPEEEDEVEATDEGSIRLLDVQRGSAVFRFVGKTPALALSYLRLAGKVLENPETVGENDYILRPIERLSATARALSCSILVKEAGQKDGVLATIGPQSYDLISKTLFITGETAITGRVVRVGGATDVRCALRVSFQTRMLFCKVANTDVARKLGDRLYQDVVAQGTARWLKNSWKVVAFTVNDVYQPKPGSLSEAFEALREAGGKAWDEIDDPEKYLEEVSGL